MKKVRKGRYRHYKGREYEVLATATNSESLEEMVVYRALYGKKRLWVRPAEMFGGKVVVKGKLVARFAYLGPSKQTL